MKLKLIVVCNLWALAMLPVLPRDAQPSRNPFGAQVALAQETPTDARGVAVLNSFLRALQTPDEAERIKACLPFLHRSLLSADGKDIDPSVRIAWKKASNNAGNYAVPVEVTRVRAKGNLTIGEGSEKVEKGRVDDYFLAKKNGVSGLPAPITLFFAEKGEPKIYYMGSL